MEFDFGSMLYVLESERERLEEEEERATVVGNGRTYSARQRRRRERPGPASPLLDPETLSRMPEPTTQAFWQTTPRPSSRSSPQGHAAAATARSRSSKRGRVPASDKAIRGLRVAAAAADESGECAICLQDLDFQADPDEAPSTLRAMPCSHAFHQGCIFEWLRRNAVCPLCRFQLPTEEEEEEAETEEDRQERARRAAILWEQYRRDFYRRERSRRRTRRTPSSS